MWKELNAPIKRFAGTSGTVTLPPGAIIIGLIAHNTSGGGTVTLPDGVGGTITAVVPAAAWFVYDPKHLNAVKQAAGTVVFTGTDSYFLEVMSTTGF